MYCGSEICIAAPKYIFPFRNMLSTRLMHTLGNYYYAVQYGHRPTLRLHNGLVLGPTSSYRHSYRVLTVCQLLYPPDQEVLSLPKTFAGFHRVSPAANRPPTCSPIAQRPAVCPHRVPPFARHLPHGGTR